MHTTNMIILVPAYMYTFFYISCL